MVPLNGLLDECPDYIDTGFPSDEELCESCSGCYVPGWSEPCMTTDEQTCLVGDQNDGTWGGSISDQIWCPTVNAAGRRALKNIAHVSLQNDGAIDVKPDFGIYDNLIGYLY